MNLLREKGMVVARTLAAALALIGGRLAWTNRPGVLYREYPDAPFPRVSSEYPDLIALAEPPHADHPTERKNDFERFRESSEYLSERGAIARTTEDERAAVQAVLDGNYVKGQLLAAQALEQHPLSVPALYALASAVQKGEGNLPDSLFLARKARHELERRGRANPADGDAREWYVRVLELEYEALVGLDRSEEALRTVELLEQVYHPLPQLKVWRLFKLKRFAEAEATIAAMERSGNWRTTALNDRLVINDVLHRRRETYLAGAKLSRGIDSPVHWSNLGESALGDFRLEEAENAYLAATRRSPNYYGTPYIPLASLYLQQGRLADAYEALTRARTQRSRREPWSIQCDQAEFDRMLTLLLLATGQCNEAERFARRCYETPDRTGYNTDTQDDRLLVDDLVLWHILAANIERLREAPSAASGPGRDLLDSAAWELQAWKLACQAARLIRQPDRPNVLRPYLPGTAECPAWLLVGIVRMLPVGVARDLVRQARTDDDHPDAIAYFDALEAQAALLGNQPGPAYQFARKALASLPDPGERALRGLTAAVAAEAATRLGRDSESLEFWNQAMVDFPTAPRLLSLGIPALIQDDGSPMAHRLTRTLSASPRLRAAAGGFLIQISTSGSSLSVSVTRPDGAQQLEESIPLVADAALAIASASRRFHERLLSPGLHLSTREINSLDGVPLNDRGRELVDGVAREAASKARAITQPGSRKPAPDPDQSKRGPM